MNKVPLYRIIKHTYYEKCDVKKEYYTIEKKWNIWRFSWWEKIKETVCGWGDCHRESITFTTESEAIYAIKKLENGNIPDGWVEEVSKVLDFNRE